MWRHCNIMFKKKKSLLRLTDGQIHCHPPQPLPLPWLSLSAAVPAWCPETDWHTDNLQNERNGHIRKSHNKAFHLVAIAQTTTLVPYHLCHVTATHLTHWGRVTLICVSNLTIIGSGNGSSPSQRQAIIWTNDGFLSTGRLGTNFSQIVFEIQTFSFKKIHWKMSSEKWQPFCLGPNVLKMGYPWMKSTVLSSKELQLTDWSQSISSVVQLLNHLGLAKQAPSHHQAVK